MVHVHKFFLQHFLIGENVHMGR